MRRLDRCSLIVLVLLTCGWYPKVTWADTHAYEEPFEKFYRSENRSFSLSGTTFKIPPKSIADIEQLLSSEKLKDPKKAEADRLLVAKEMPEGKTGRKNFYNYLELANAFERIGRFAEVRRNLKAASEIFGHNNFPDRVILYDVIAVKFRFSRALIESGFFKKGLTALNGVEDLIWRVNLPGTRTRITAELSYLNALAGRVEEAERYAESAMQEYASFSSTNFYSLNTFVQKLTECSIYRMQGVILGFRGEIKEAIRFLRWSTESCKWVFENGGTPAGAHVELIFSMEPRSYPSQRRYRRAIDLYVEVLVRGGRLVEAESVIRTAIKASLASTGRNSILTTNHLLSLSNVLLAQGRLKDAETIAGKIIGFHRNAGFSETNTAKLKAHLVKARALAGQNMWREAGVEFSFVQDAIGGQPSILTSSLRASPAFGLALSYSGKHAAAEQLLTELFTFNKETLGERSITTALSRGALGVVLNRSGKGVEARPLLEAVSPVISEYSRRSAMDSTKDAEFNQWKRLIYEAYLDQLASSFDKVDDPIILAKAFEVAQLAAGGSVQKAFAASSTRAAVDDEELSGLVRQYQDLVQRFKNLNGLLLNRINQSGEEGSEVALRKLRNQISDIKAVQVSLADEIEDRFPEYSNLMNPRPVSLITVRASLKPDEALIVTHVGDEKSYVWAIPKSGEMAFSASGLGKEKLQKVIGSLRRSLNPTVEILGDIPAFNIELAGKIYREILEPVATGWKSAKNLLIVPDGPLGQLPFSVLVSKPSELEEKSDAYFVGYKKVAFLVKSHSAAVIPSVSSLIALRNLPPNGRERKSFVGIADPFFSKQQEAEARAENEKLQIADNMPTVRGLPIRLRAAPQLHGVSTADLALLPRLPDTADEVIGIAKVLKADPEKDVFLGRDASEGKVRKLDLAQYKVIAFATHGLMAGDLDGLTEPALALTSPAVSGEQGDGLLSLGEILALKLDADWVILSACNTGSADGETSEALSGLPRAFFYAGARALLISNWPVETISAKKLTTDIFRRQSAQPDLSRAQALRLSMLQLLNGPGFIDQNGKTVFSYAHPIFWAPFALVGDGAVNRN